MKRKPNSAPPHAARDANRTQGFTLLEVLVAVSIFAICATALLASFRIATKAFSAGRKAAETMQTLRFTVEHISRDLRAVYYENDYNQKFVFLQYQMRQDETMQIERLHQELDDYENGETEAGFVGLKLDLHFLGKGKEAAGGDSAGATIEFAHFVTSDGTYETATWGAERVRYYLGGENGTDLYRQRSPIQKIVKVNPNLEEEVHAAQESRMAAAAGRPVPKKGEKFEEGDPNAILARVKALAQQGGGILPPEFQEPLDVNYLVEETLLEYPPELLAENISNFDLKFGYFADDWKETNTWDSDEKANRVPPFNVLVDDPQFLQKLMEYRRRPTDYLPAYIKLILTIQDQDAKRKENDKSARKSHHVDIVIWMPSALETYVPEDQDYFEPTVF